MVTLTYNTTLNITLNCVCNHILKPVTCNQLGSTYHIYVFISMKQRISVFEGNCQNTCHLIQYYHKPCMCLLHTLHVYICMYGSYIAILIIIIL